MTPQEKLVLEMFAKQLEIVNSTIDDLYLRTKILEQTMLSNPDLMAQYQQAAKDTKRVSAPGLTRQLSAIQQELSRIRG